MQSTHGFNRVMRGWMQPVLGVNENLVALYQIYS